MAPLIPEIVSLKYPHWPRLKLYFLKSTTIGQSFVEKCLNKNMVMTLRILQKMFFNKILLKNKSFSWDSYLNSFECSLKIHGYETFSLKYSCLWLSGSVKKLSLKIHFYCPEYRWTNLTYYSSVYTWKHFFKNLHVSGS